MRWSCSKKGLEINSYLAHTENITLAMVNNDDIIEIRRRAWSKILKAREQYTPGEIRKFVNPKNKSKLCKLSRAGNDRNIRVLLGVESEGNTERRWF